MTTNMFVEQEWIDYKLKWEPDEYGGVTKLHVPAEQIWLPGWNVLSVKERTDFNETDFF